MSVVSSLPLRQPSDFASVMMGTLKAQRLLTAVKLQFPEKVCSQWPPCTPTFLRLRSLSSSHQVETVARALWRRVWATDSDITKPESLAAALRAGDFDESTIQRLIGAMKDPQVKAALKATTVHSAIVAVSCVECWL